MHAFICKLLAHQSEISQSVLAAVFDFFDFLDFFGFFLDFQSFLDFLDFLDFSHLHT